MSLTNVKLLNVPLENDYKHTLYFGSAATQAAYFLGRTVHDKEGFSYQRKEGVIKYPEHYDRLQNCNYIMYQNKEVNNKWFYAFITKMEYKNTDTTWIYFEIDVLQTYMFDYTVKPSFIEREHVTNDAIGANTVPENLETGEFVINETLINETLQPTTMVIGVTLDINDYTNQAGDWNTSREFAPAHGAMYDGIYSGLKYFQINASELKTVLKHITYEGQDDAINSIFMAPTNMLRLGEQGKYGKEVVSNSMPNSESWYVGKTPTSLNGYTPRNKKLLTTPFCYMVLDNNGGGAVTYNYEKFTTEQIGFKIYSTITPGMSIRIVPQYYNGCAENHSEGLNLSKYATCSWNSDAFTSWLSQNAINIGINTALGVGSTALGVAGALAAPATGGASLAVTAAMFGGVSAIGTQLGSIATHAQVPPQIHGNTNGGDVATAMKNVTFTLYKMSIKKEYAQIIDDFFDMFGYKVNRVKVPNKNHRPQYWYTKTIDVKIEGAIPMEYLSTIKQCYNTGVTFWKDPAKIGDYSVSNTI